MSMKKKILRILSCIITICLTIVILSKLTDIMERKSSDQKYSDFWSQEEDFDVLFMGTSLVINGVFPMELWNDYGIVSYNFGGHGNQIPTTYWVMENALEKTTPKVVVIDCMKVEENDKCSIAFEYLHLSFDTFPLNSTKVKAVWDLLDDPTLEENIANGNVSEGDEQRTRIGLLWDYSVYHSRWNEISRNDFELPMLYEKGAESRIAVAGGSLNKISSNNKIAPGSTGDKYLRMMIEDCQKRGIDVVLTYMPFLASESQQRTANYIYDIAKEYDVDYINFLDVDLINYQTDLSDGEAHLNPSGARKITNYLGGYLVANYDIPDRRNDMNYDYWNIDYDEYVSMKNKNLVESANLVDYLMLLSGDDVEIRMDVRDKSIFSNGLIMDLLANIGVDTSQISNDTDFIIITDRGQNVTVVNGLRKDGSSQQTNLGEMKIYYGEKGYYGLYLNDEELMIGNTEDGAGLQIDVYRKEDRIDSVKYVSFEKGLEHDEQNKED